MKKAISLILCNFIIGLEWKHEENITNNFILYNFK